MVLGESLSRSIRVGSSLIMQIHMSALETRAKCLNAIKGFHLVVGSDVKLIVFFFFFY